MKQNTVLVAGGAGFLGSHLCDKLVAKGKKVLCIDNFFTGQKKNVEHLLDNPNFQLIEHDVCNPIDVEVAEIYNFACPASPKHYQSDPLRTIKTSIFGAINLLELARKQNATIFQASTSEVYGDPQEHPQKEEYWGFVNPIGLRACYDESKRCSETLFFDYARKYNMSIKVGRIFNTYGPRMHPDDGRVVSNFIVQALQNEPLTIYGNGAQTRSFCFVDDLIEAIVAFMGTNHSMTGPLNLGNPEEFTILELAQEVLKIVKKSSSKITFQKIAPDDPKQRRPDISKAKKILNWSPKIPLRTGLSATVAYFSHLFLKEPFPL